MSASRDDFGIAIRSALLQRGAATKFSLISLKLVSEIPEKYVSLEQENKIIELNKAIKIRGFFKIFTIKTNKV